MTTLAFHLSRALGRELGPGDEIVVTELDHHANVAPWHALVRERGVTLHTIRMLTETCELDWEEFERKLGGKTRLVAVGAASNAVGTITDVRRAADMAHAVGALVFVDAVHYAPHVLADVTELGCDFLGCSAYKFYGPHIGVLYGRRELLESIDFPKLIPAPDTAPERIETGTQNHEGMIGAAAAVDFLASLAVGPDGPAGLGSRRARLRSSFAALHRRASALTLQLRDGLSAIEGVRLFGPAPGKPRTPTLSFTVGGVTSTDVARGLASRGIFASHGDFYAHTVIERLGLAPEGLVRAGCACYTNEEEVQRLVHAVRAIAGGR
jgi:cysteine desulfurase family protein (TIGR01976 family)